MRKCKCGEVRQSMFYGKERSRCISCRSKYNIEYYARKKKKACAERKAVKQQSTSCPDGEGISFSSDDLFKRFCQARRFLRGWREGQVISCGDCNLQDRVDTGFIPKNIAIMKISLMARMN